MSTSTATSHIFPLEKNLTRERKYGRFYSDMELEFGPGIVDRLKSKFATAASTHVALGRPSDQRQSDMLTTARKINKVKQANDTTTDTILSQSKLLTNDKIIIIDRHHVNGLYGPNITTTAPSVRSSVYEKNTSLATQLVNKSECIEGLVSHVKAIFDGNSGLSLDAPDGSQPLQPPVRQRLKRDSLQNDAGLRNGQSLDGKSRYSLDVFSSSSFDSKSSDPRLSTDVDLPVSHLRKSDISSFDQKMAPDFISSSDAEGAHAVAGRSSLDARPAYDNSAPALFERKDISRSIPPTPPPRPNRRAALESSRVPKGRLDDKLSLNDKNTGDFKPDDIQKSVGPKEDIRLPSVADSVADGGKVSVPVLDRNLSVDKETDMKKEKPAPQLKRAPPVTPRPASLFHLVAPKPRSTQHLPEPPKITAPRPVLTLSRPISPARKNAHESSPPKPLVDTRSLEEPSKVSRQTMVQPASALRPGEEKVLESAKVVPEKVTQPASVVRTYDGKGLQEPISKPREIVGHSTSVLKPVSDGKVEMKRVMSQDESPMFRRSASLDMLEERTGDKEKRPGKFAKMEEKGVVEPLTKEKIVSEKKASDSVEKADKATAWTSTKPATQRPRSLPEPTPEPSSESDTEKENTNSFRLAFPLKKASNLGMTTIIDTRSCPINPVQSALKIDDPSLLTSLKDLGRAKSSLTSDETYDIEVETMKFVVIGHNSPVSAKSSLKVAGALTKTRAHLRIQFDDKATKTYEYPSERSFVVGAVQFEMEVESVESETDDVPRREGDLLKKIALSSYRPGTVEAFSLGLERPVFEEEVTKEIVEEQRTRKERPHFHVENQNDERFSDTTSSTDHLLF